ncbi:MBL fold metallo-hydrolase [Roseomonas sp. OT10]|uniref:MBL fold metallo-hydrolase n=1 Tax=Roseomonas cutis TaxID=2897332 RepID=UPI001E40C8EB|nr:MBL fold metallo-hydrolase [Roseomonas sp. OT10]UFN50030.1 MBL fold metallo-hydrolase [Roseomonas sp. OT10]
MTVFLCTACGTSYPDAPLLPAHCTICDEERQYVPLSGQNWIAREDLPKAHRNAWKRYEPDLFCLQTLPAFGINQRAWLIRTPQGNVLWDCIALFDAATEEIIRALGGIRAIAISHPHYYTTMQDWAAAFGAPVYLHARDREWVMRPDPSLTFWEGDEMALWPGLTLHRLGGHFPGGTVLHWPGTADGAGALMAGDIVQVAPGAKRVSFLWSYPNMMPLPAAEVRRMAARLAPLRYERIYGAFLGQEVAADGPGIVARSAARYVELLDSPGNG